MLKDCLDRFKGLYAELGDDLINNSYILSPGSYVIVNQDGSFRVAMEIDKKSNDRDSADYQYIAKRDYLSRLIDMNKPIDGHKKIHSNNYCSFFIKKEFKLKNSEKREVNIHICKSDLIDSELKEQFIKIIEGYFNVFSDPESKYYYDKKKCSLFKEVEKKVGKSDANKIKFHREWIINNLFEVAKNIKNNKEYLKIFFEEDLDIYENESEKYIIPNLYNSNEFNVLVDDDIYGVPNDNMGLNSNKPFLKHKNRKNEAPYLLNTQEVLIQKKFFDYLYNFASEGKYNIYFNSNVFMAFNDKESILEKEPNFEGFYLRIKKGREVEILDQDVVSFRSLVNKDFIISNILNLYNADKETFIKYNEKCSLIDISDMVNEVFFRKYLANNYFNDSKDIILYDSKVKECLLLSRTAFRNWFYKGNSSSIKLLINRVTLQLLKNSIKNGNVYRAIEQFNLRIALLEYFELEGDKMGDKISDLASKLRVKINASITETIDSDEEYYFSIGQVVSYLISLNKASRKQHLLINPIINSKSNERIKTNIKNLYKRYNYAIDSKRFNNLYAMVSGYEADSKVNEDLIIAGYLHSCLIYEKKNSEVT